MSKVLRACVLVMVLSVLWASASLAEEFMEKTTTFNFQAGFISPGTFWVDDYDADTDMSYSLSAGLDYKLGPKISGGLLTNISNFGYEDASSTMFEFGFSLKAWIKPENTNIIFRPGFGLCYGALSSNDYVDSAGFFIIHGTVEAIFPMENGINWLAMIGITGSPTGGNDDFEMSYGPGFIMRGGVAF
ncbi:MAG: hypothetical protein JW746_01050 [Candidatus Krumholzibacteriota bacterium]|nr:hypothetical protein [Candidatus Krumholzibacteriota bacterium]